MKYDYFVNMVAHIFESCEDVLYAKAREYGSEDDVLSGLKTIANFSGRTPQQECFSLMLKHLASIKEKIDRGEKTDSDWRHEKIVDTINYLVLLWALYEEDCWSDCSGDVSASGH